MFNSGNEPPKKTQKELDKEEEDKRIMEAEKAKHNLYWRLGDSKSELDTGCLDADELACLNEVSRKGYYHNRPQTDMDVSAPKRIDPEEEFKKVTFNGPKKRPLVRRDPKEAEALRKAKEAEAKAEAKAAKEAEAKAAREAEIRRRPSPSRSMKTEAKEAARETPVQKPVGGKPPVQSVAREQAGQSTGWMCCRRRHDHFSEID